MKQKHQDEQCPKIKLPCFNQCGLTVTREDMDRHIGQDCANAESTCPYEFGACAYEVYYFLMIFIHIYTTSTLNGWFSRYVIAAVLDELNA